MSWLSRLAGQPFVYHVIRPLVIGGLDFTPVYERLGVQPDDTIVDVGCGTGSALEHLSGFARYVGFDTDERAVAAARRSAARDERPVEFHCREITAADVEQIAPDLAVLAGLLHHVDDAGCVRLLELLRRSPRLRRVTTLDVTLLPHRFINNLLAILDRGQYPRHPGGFVALAEQAGYRAEEALLVPSRPGNRRVSYWLMSLVPLRKPTVPRGAPGGL